MITILALIVLDALKDAVKDRQKTLGHVLNGIFLLVVLALVTTYRADNPGAWIGAYILLRYALFNLVYNLIRGLPIFYIGTTDPIDDLIRGFLYWTKFSSTHFQFLTKLIALCIGLSIAIEQQGWM